MNYLIIALHYVTIFKFKDVKFRPRFNFVPIPKVYLIISGIFICEVK